MHFSTGGKKMKTGKRFLSLLLAVIIAVSGICAVNIAIASAADYTSASTLLSGIATTGSLTETGVKNWYRFTAPASSTEITFTHDAKSDTGAYFRVQVFTEANAAAATSPAAREDSLGTDGTKTISVNTTQGSSYYVSVEATSTNAVNLSYTVKYSAAVNQEKESNDTTASATNLTIGAATKGVCSTNTDVDYYAVTLSESLYLDVKLAHTAVPNVTSKYFIVTIFASDGTTRVESFESLGKQATSSLSDLDSVGEYGVPLAPGKYFIKVEDGGAVSGAEYQITAITTPIPDHDDEVENNNTQSTANAIRSGMPMLAALNQTKEGTKDTDDFFKFTIDTPAIVGVTLSHAVKSSSGVYYRVELLNTAGEQIDSFKSLGNDSTVAGSKKFVSVGTYYIHVYRDPSAGDIDSILTYSLNVEIAKVSGAEEEANDDFTSANAIRCGTATESTYYHASLQTAEDKDYFKFTINRGYVYVNFFSEDGGECNTVYQATIYVLSENAGLVEHYKIFDFDVTYVDGQFKSGCIGLDSGTYYIVVDHKSYDATKQGAYGVGIQYTEYNGYETELNNTAATADNFEKGESMLYINASCFDTSDNDWFKFKTEKKIKFTVNCRREYTNAEKVAGVKDPSEYKWNVEVYNAADLSKHIISSSFTSYKDMSETETLEPGTYYVRVTGVSSAFSNKNYFVFLTFEEDPGPMNIITIIINLVKTIRNLDWSAWKPFLDWLKNIDWVASVKIWYNAIKRVIEFIKIIR